MCKCVYVYVYICIHIYIYMMRGNANRSLIVLYMLIGEGTYVAPPETGLEHAWRTMDRKGG